MYFQCKCCIIIIELQLFLVTRIPRDIMLYTYAVFLLTDLLTAKGMHHLLITSLSGCTSYKLQVRGVNTTASLL